MDHVVGAELAYAVSHRGYPTLRFNYRGVGGSQGEPSRLPDAWLEDAVEALKLAMENTQQPVVLAALGASDAVALRLAERAEVAGVVLINPSIVQPADFVNRGPAPWPLMVVVAEHDATVDRPLWSAVLQGLGAHFAVIPEATRTYQRNLPLVGKAVVSLVEKALSCDGQDTIVS